MVEYRPTSNPAFKTHLVEKDLSATLDDLTPSTEYEVRVREDNALGHSDPSTSKLTKTKHDCELSMGSEFPSVSVAHFRIFLIRTAVNLCSKNEA